MTTDLISRAEARITEITDAITALAVARVDIQSAESNLLALLPEAPFPHNNGRVRDKAADHGTVGTGNRATFDNAGGENVAVASAPIAGGEGAAKAPPATTSKPVTLTDPIVSTRKPPNPFGQNGKVTLADRIRAHLVDHPNDPAGDIAKALGKPESRIATAANRANIVLRKLTAAEIRERIRAGRAKAGLPISGAKPAQVSTPPSTAPNEPVRPVPTTAPRGMPKGQRFYLQDRATGFYLHMAGTVGSDGKPYLTQTKQYAWCDVQDRLFNMRKAMPGLLDDFREVAA